MKKTKLHPLILQLRELADAKGINWTQVAVRAGIDPSVTWRVFSGERTCTVETFAKIAAGIGLAIEIKG